MSPRRHVASSTRVRVRRLSTVFPFRLLLVVGVLVAWYGAGYTPRVVAAGTTYYVDCADGYDGNDGTSTDAAWRSLSRANNADLTPGSRLLLKRDCTWTGPLKLSWSGTNDAPILIGAYDQGNLPKIQNAPDSNVVLQGSYLVVENIDTRSDAPGYASGCDNNPEGRRIGFRFTSGATYNVLRNSRARNQYFGMYLTEGSHHNKIVNNVLQNNNMIDPNHGSDAGAVAIALNSSDDNEVAYNTISGSDACSFVNNDRRDGSAVEVYGGRRNNIHHNRIHNNNTFTELGNPRSANNTFAYNIVTGTNYRAHFLVTRGSGSQYGPVYGTVAYNNTVYLTDPSSFAINCNPGCNTSVLKLKNNIIWAEGKIGYMNQPADEDNNIFWRADGKPVVYFPTPSDMSASDKKADPQFVDRGAFDFHLRGSSPAINAGTSESTNAGYRADYDGNTVPQAGQVDIGAFEYGSTAAPPPSNTTITNGSFEDGDGSEIVGWRLQVRSGADASLNRDDASPYSGSYAAKINITAASSKRYYVQFAQPGLRLDAGQSYTLSFRAKASAERKAQVSMQQADVPYRVYKEQDVSLDTQWQQYIINFTASATDANAAVEFNLAEATGTVWLDTVALTPQINAAAPSSVPDDTVQDAYHQYLPLVSR